MDQPACRVLLVEDNEDDYLIVRDLLSDIATTRFELQWVDNGDDARAVLAQHNHDICLLDYHLGAVTGVELAREYSQGETPFILLTGNDDYQIDVAAAKAGIADYLVKGNINAALLDRSIRYAIERKKSVAALSQAQRFAQATVDALPHYLAVIDERGTIIAVNTAWREYSQDDGFLGASSDIGANYLEACERSEVADARLVAAGIRAVLCDEHPTFCLEYASRPDAESRWFQVGATRFVGGPLHVVVTHEDVTQRKAADATMERLASIVESSDDAIIGKTLDGIVTSWNGGAQTLYGYAASEALGRSMLQLGLIAPANGDEDAHLLEKLRRSEIITGYETVRLHRSGRYFDVSLTLSPVKNEEGEIVGASTISRDISARKQAETALLKMRDDLEVRVAERTRGLEQANREAEQARESAEIANRAKSEFLSRMSHELRTPLNAILGFGQIMEMQQDDPDSEEFDNVQQILKAGRHLLKLINEVLDLARIEAGHLSLSLETVDAGLVVDEVLGMVWPLTQHSDIQLINAMKECHFQVVADQQRLKQVLLNLLSNAVKYNRAGGQVVVSCQEQSGEETKNSGVECRGWLRFCVRDTGPGLSASDIERIFIPFERLDATFTQIEGTGIGLPLSKFLVEAMHGSIGVESEPGRGSTFWLELPLAKTLSATPAAETPMAREPAPPIFEGQRTMLCIEDNLSNIHLIERVLADLDEKFHLLPAMQGSLGVELAAQHRPDVILLDVNLPDMMGDAVLERLKADSATKDIPVIVLSADATPHQIDRLLAAGAVHYLTKPLDLKLFLSVLREVLGTRPGSD